MERRTLAVAAFLTAAVIALAAGSVRLDSVTSDEPAHIAAGLVKLQHGNLDFFREQPPLMNSISALPLLLSGYRVPPWTGSDVHWTVGRQFLYAPGHDTPGILFLARLPTILLLAVLGWAVYWFVLRYSGSGWWGLFAFALTTLCPTVMAHGRLATVDLAVTLFCFCSAALFIRLLEAPSLLLAAGVGLATAAALLTKTSANLLGPYLLLLFLVAWAGGRLPAPSRAAAMAAASGLVCVIVVTVAVLLWAGPAYEARFSGVPRIAIPILDYVDNVRTIAKWYSRGAAGPQFLLGEFSPQGWRHYYLVAFVLKATIPAMMILLLALGAAIKHRRVSFPVVGLLLFVLLFAGAAAAGHLALGVRYVLPVFPFLFAAAAIILARTPRLAVTAVALLAWHAGENLRAYPSYLSYFNQLIGSHRNADRYLIDSNLDWGQDLRRLDLWLRERNIDTVILHYFGGGVPQLDLSARVIGGYGPGGRPLPRGSWFALSRHFYRVSFDGAVARETYDDFLQRSGARLVDTVGGSINVYRVGD